jgi:hypothetical protein
LVLRRIHESEMIQTIQHYASLVVYLSVGIQHCKPPKWSFWSKSLYHLRTCVLEKKEWMRHNEHSFVDIIADIARQAEKAD